MVLFNNTFRFIVIHFPVQGTIQYFDYLLLEIFMWNIVSISSVTVNIFVWDVLIQYLESTRESV